MTDITEQAQREKFEAWAEEAGALPWGILGKHRKQDGNYPGPHYTYMWKAWQAASAELVEALEKAQQRIDELESDEVRQRLANAEHQLYMAELAKHNLKASRKAQFRKRKAAEKRIAELEEAQSMHESDTLMLCRQFDELAAAMGWSSELAMQQGVSQLEYARSLKERIADLESRTVTVKLPEPFKLAKSSSGLTYYYADEVNEALTAQGIKWEAE